MWWFLSHTLFSSMPLCADFEGYFLFTFLYASHVIPYQLYTLTSRVCHPIHLCWHVVKPKHNQYPSVHPHWTVGTQEIEIEVHILASQRQWLSQLCIRLVIRRSGSIRAGSGKILPWRLMMKYFLQPFSLFCWFKKGICQFLVKEYAQVLVNCLEG